jgi:hypothetical protein
VVAIGTGPSSNAKGIAQKGVMVEFRKGFHLTTIHNPLVVISPGDFIVCCLPSWLLRGQWPAAKSSGLFGYNAHRLYFMKRVLRC